MFSEKTTPLTKLNSPLFEQKGVSVWMKREELNHPLIQGNKWHKLRFNIEAALKQHKTTLLTFGGAYSNHIAATAIAAKQAGLNSIGIIRGQELYDRPDKWSHTLHNAAKNGMHFQFVSRIDYRDKANPETLISLQKTYPEAYILPEGGSNELAVQGFKSLMVQIETQCPGWTHLFTAVGTGGTLTGLVKYAKLQNKRTILGVPVLKQGDYLYPEIEKWINSAAVNHWQLLTEYHAGGYAKTSPKLQLIMQDFKKEFSIDLDPIYTVKMVNAFYDQLNQDQIKPGSKVVLLHTGGLQGCYKPL